MSGRVGVSAQESHRQRTARTVETAASPGRVAARRLDRGARLVGLQAASMFYLGWPAGCAGPWNGGPDSVLSPASSGTPTPRNRTPWTRLRALSSLADIACS